MRKLRILRTISIAVLLTLSAASYYAVFYRTAAVREDGPARGAGTYDFYRFFRHDWQARLFIPAAFCEARLIGFWPKAFFTYPNWIESDLRRVLVLKGESIWYQFPITRRPVAEAHKPKR